MRFLLKSLFSIEPKDLSKLIEFNVFRDRLKIKQLWLHGNSKVKKIFIPLKNTELILSNSRIRFKNINRDFILFLSKNNIPGILFSQPKLATSLLKEGLFDYLFCYQAPMLLLIKTLIA